MALLAGCPDERGFADGSGRAAMFNCPVGLCCVMESVAGGAVEEVLYCCDERNHRIRRVSAQGSSQACVRWKPFAEAVVMVMQVW